MVEEVQRGYEDVSGESFLVVYRLQDPLMGMTIYDACIQVEDMDVPLFGATSDSSLVTSLKHRSMFSKAVRGSQEWSWWFMFFGLDRLEGTHKPMSLDELKIDIQGVLAQFGELRQLEKERATPVATMNSVPKPKRMKSVLAHT